MRSCFVRAIAALGIALPASTQAQSVSVTGGAPQTQTFDSLSSDPTTPSNALPGGWYLAESDTNANATYLGDNGSNPSGNTYSYGSTGSNERAFGMLQSGSLVPTIGAQLQNDTGSTLTQLQVEYEGEQWRIGTQSRPDRADFQYSLDATSLTSGTWTNVDALDFTAPNTTATVGPLDGNSNFASKSAVIAGLSLANGSTMWVRWTDLNASGADDGLAIDNVVFSIPGDSPPALGSSVPAAGATAVARDQTITLDFTEPVTTSGAWYTLACADSGAHASQAGGTGATRTIDPDVDFGFDEDCTLTLDPALIVDQDLPADPLAGGTRVTFHTALEPVDLRPEVESIVPAAGASNVATNASPTIKFTEAVTAPATAFALSCASSGSHAFALAGGPSTYTLDPGVDFDEVETCTVTIDADQVLDQDGAIESMVADFLASFTTRAGSGAYYDGVDASSCVALRTTLHATIDDHAAATYSQAWTILESADQDPLVTGNVLDVYRNRSYAKIDCRVGVASSCAGGDANRYNREHTWPNSHGFNDVTFLDGFPYSPYTDAHMLYISAVDYNSNRGNKYFANCAGCSENATDAYAGFGGGTGVYPGNSNWNGGATYEAWNHRKGDVARAILYMDVRYEGDPHANGQREPNLIVTDDLQLVDDTTASGAYAAVGYMGLKSTLLQWHAADPPDAAEGLRNDVVQLSQQNRNPFIDHPEWVGIAFADPCTGTAPANRPPVLGNVAASVLENAANGTTLTTLVASDPDAGQALSYSIQAGNANGAFAIGASTGAITVANAALVDRAVAAAYALTVRATDNGSPSMSDDATLSITITQVNDAPSFKKGADATVDEDAGAQSLPGWATAISAGPSDESTQTVGFEVTGNTNAPLFAVAPAIAANGTLSYTPAANANGSATISVRARDDGLTANGGVDASAVQTFIVTVNPVNDAPSFIVGANQTVAENAGAQSVTGWATAISAGAADESGQAVGFAIVSSSNPTLFAAAPAVAPDGTLSYTPATDAFGMATIEVRAIDDGDTANGGTNESQSQSFTITVTQAADQLAVATDDAPAAILEDAATTTFAVLGNDSDADGDAFAVIGVSQPATEGVAAVGTNGADVTFTPAANFCGTTSFTYTITGGGSATVSVSVTCVNDAPTASDANSSVVAGSAVGTAVATVTATDIENDALSYAITSGNTGDAFAIDPATGAITVASSADVAAAASPFALAITVRDDGTPSRSGTATVTVTVTAAPPDALFAHGFE